MTFLRPCDRDHRARTIRARVAFVERRLETRRGSLATGWTVGGRTPARALGVCLLLSAAACDGSRGTSVSPAVSPRPPLAGVEFSGCSVVEHGRRCELSAPRRLTFWLPPPRRLAAVRCDGTALSLPPAVAIEGGLRYEIHVPVGARRLELQGAAGGTFALSLAAASPADVLERAQTLREGGRFEEARALLVKALPELAEPRRSRARAQLARLTLAEGDPDTAARELTSTMHAAFDAGRLSDGLYDATALAFIHTTHARDYSAARAVLELAARHAPRDPSHAALVPHYEGVLALETGDLRTALTSFRHSARRAARLGLLDHALLAREQEAWALALLGRHDEAVDSQREIVDAFPSTDACQRADRAESVVWFGLLAEPPPGSSLAQTIAAYSTRASRELSGCPSPWRARNHRINAALHALQQAELERAGALLAELARPSTLRDPVLDTWERELRGRHALLTGQPRRALVEFRAALAEADRAGLWDNQHLAQLGAARALRALGRTRESLAAYEAAEHSLDDTLASVPLSEGQAGFRRAREAGTQEWIRLLLQAGAPARAFEVARSARARRLSSLAAVERARSLSPAARARWEHWLSRYQERRSLAEKLENDAWQLPKDQLAEHRRTVGRHRQEAREALDAAYAVLDRARVPVLRLRAPTAGEAVLGLFPDGDRWRTYLQRGDRVRSRELPASEPSRLPADLGDRLLAGYARELEGVTTLRVIAHPSLSWLDVHGSSFEGAPLLERFHVAYGADSPRPATPDAAESGWLVVLDPRGDLRAAQAEAELVAPDRPGVELLFGTGARRDELLRRLPHVELFHYAGHHRFAGIEGTDSAFLLADGEVSVGDVLTLPRGPSQVVLATCEAAKHEGPGFRGGLGMAQSFIAIGAREVVAAHRPVPDHDARELVRALYAARREGEASDLGSPLRRAQLRLAHSQPALDWRAFRVIVP